MLKRRVAQSPTAAPLSWKRARSTYWVLEVEPGPERDEGAVAEVDVHREYAGLAIRVPDPLREIGAPDLPVGAGIVVRIRRCRDLHVDVGRVHELPVGGRLGDRGRCGRRRGCGWRKDQRQQNGNGRHTSSGHWPRTALACRFVTWNFFLHLRIAAFSLNRRGAAAGELST